MSPFSSKVFLWGVSNIEISANTVIFLGVLNHDTVDCTLFTLCIIDGNQNSLSLQKIIENLLWVNTAQSVGYRGEEESQMFAFMELILREETDDKDIK